MWRQVRGGGNGANREALNRPVGVWRRPTLWHSPRNVGFVGLCDAVASLVGGGVTQAVRPPCSGWSSLSVCRFHGSPTGAWATILAQMPHPQTRPTSTLSTFCGPGREGRRACSPLDAA